MIVEYVGTAGDVRLSELKVALATEGMPTEFVAGGALLCGGRIGIRRDTDGTVLLEGPLSEDYYRVRSIIYDHYHIC
jgi:cleavage and polyadenylation specificity factor subunit 2